MAYVLVFNLVVEMPREPIRKPRLLDVTGPSQLHVDPVLPLVSVNLHGEVADLGHPRKPVALQEPDEEIPAETGPEPAQQGGKGQVKQQVEHAQPKGILKKLEVSLKAIQN